MDISSVLIKLLIVCPGYFLAGFADSIAGGGGIISIPVALLAGIPIHTVYGTNKFAMSFGTSISVFKYGKSGAVRWPVALFAAAGALPGASLGAKLALLMSERYLTCCLMALLPAITVFLAVNKGFGEAEGEKRLPRARESLLAALIGLAVGAYDGFFGPGAGTFYIMLFSSLLGLGLLPASGSAKAANLASNLGALISFMAAGKVWFIIGVPAALSAIAGNALGSGLAIKNGAKCIRPIMAAMLILLFIKVLTQFVP